MLPCNFNQHFLVARQTLANNPQRSSRLSLPVKEADGRYGQNPLFADEDGKDLRLMKTSPVHDAGVRIKTDEIRQ